MLYMDVTTLVAKAKGGAEVPGCAVYELLQEVQDATEPQEI